MTSDEFERIMVALCSMANFKGPGGELFVSLPRAMMIIYSQLHPDDKSKWVYNPNTVGWSHIEDNENPGPKL